jgi:hypothetical protein
MTRGGSCGWPAQAASSTGKNHGNTMRHKPEAAVEIESLVSRILEIIFTALNRKRGQPAPFPCYCFL